MAAVAGVSLAVLLVQQPWDRWSHGDIALHQVFGRLIADGQVPYRDFFDQKTPLAWYLNAVPALISRHLGADYVLAARALSVLLAVGGSVGLYLVARSASLGRTMSAVAALLFLAFDYHNYFAIRGIDPKLLNSYVGIFGLLAAYHSRWLLAGVLCALAFLAFPPAGVFLLGAGTLALMSGRATARKAIPRLGAGFVAPIAVLLIYFVVVGALDDFWADNVIFNRQYVSQQFSWLRIELMAERITSDHRSDRWLFLVGAIGFATYAGSLAWGLFRRVPSHVMPALPVAVVTVAVFTYSYVNFWTAGDVLPFLPWIAFWGAWLLEQPARQPTRWAYWAAVGGALVLLGYGYHSLPDLTDIGNPPDEGAIVRGIEQRARLQPGDPIYVQEEQWYLLLSERDHLSRYYFVRNAVYKYAEEREGTYEALLRPLIEEKPKLFVMSDQRDWLAQSAWSPLQRIFGPILLWSYTRLDPASINYGFSSRAEFWVLRAPGDFQDPGTDLLRRWQPEDARLSEEAGGTLVASDQGTYAVSQRVAAFGVPIGRGAVYAAIVWVKGSADSREEAAKIVVMEDGGAQRRSEALFGLSGDWQPVVVIHRVDQIVPDALTVQVVKENFMGKGDSFLIREGQLRLLVPGLPD